MTDMNLPIFRLDSRKPAPGLHFVATPIGAARDITLRALDILAMADVLAAEDTRTLRHLMDIHGIAVNGRPMVAYHDHNGAEARPRLLRALQDGKSVAYASEAGTPLLADPGFQSSKAAIAENLQVYAAPGPSALLAALAVAGLPTDRFLFAGFAPPNAGPRRTWLEDLAKIDATIVLYESPKRVGKLLTEMLLPFGEDRSVALCRELTKRFEEVRRGTLGDLVESVDAHVWKGEFVLVIGRPAKVVMASEDAAAALAAALATGERLKDASARLAASLGMAKRDLYQLGLTLGDPDDGDA